MLARVFVPLNSRARGEFGNVRSTQSSAHGHRGESSNFCSWELSWFGFTCKYANTRCVSLSTKAMELQSAPTQSICLSVYLYRVCVSSYELHQRKGLTRRSEISSSPRAACANRRLSLGGGGAMGTSKASVVTAQAARAVRSGAIAPTWRHETLCSEKKRTQYNKA